MVRIGAEPVRFNNCSCKNQMSRMTAVWRRGAAKARQNKSKTSFPAKA